MFPFYSYFFFVIFFKTHQLPTLMHSTIGMMDTAKWWIQMIKNDESFLSFFFCKFFLQEVMVTIIFCYSSLSVVWSWLNKGYTWSRFNDRSVVCDRAISICHHFLLLIILYHFFLPRSNYSILFYLILVLIILYNFILYYFNLFILFYSILFDFITYHSLSFHLVSFWFINSILFHLI